MGAGSKRARYSGANGLFEFPILCIFLFYFMHLSVKVQGLFEWSKIGGCLL